MDLDAGDVYVSARNIGRYSWRRPPYGTLCDLMDNNPWHRSVYKEGSRFRREIKINYMVSTLVVTSQGSGIRVERLEAGGSKD